MASCRITTCALFVLISRMTPRAPNDLVAALGAACANKLPDPKPPVVARPDRITAVINAHCLIGPSSLIRDWAIVQLDRTPDYWSRDCRHNSSDCSRPRWLRWEPNSRARGWWPVG